MSPNRNVRKVVAAPAPTRIATRTTGLAPLAGLIAASLLGATGCSTGGGDGHAYFARFSGRDAVESQLTGEALAQQK